MDLTPLVLITIIAEPVLEETITAELLRLGATGYTVGEVHGRGSRGIRSGDIPGASVRIETVLPPLVARRVLERVQELWFPHYAVIAWKTAVEVVRGDKYVRD